MALDYCLPKDLVDKFLSEFPMDRDRQKSSYDKLLGLARMSSDDRRTWIGNIIGEDHAKAVNTLFEEKMALRYKDGLIDLVRNERNFSPAQKTDILDRLEKTGTKIIQPAYENAFLADYAEKQMGLQVTPEQAKTVFDLAAKARQAREARKPFLDTNVNPLEIYGNTELGKKIGLTRTEAFNRNVEYGQAIKDLQDYVMSIRPSKENPWLNPLNYWNAPRTFQVSALHFSGFGVQALKYLSFDIPLKAITTPLRAAKFLTKPYTYYGLPQMFRFFYDQRNYDEFQAYMAGHPMIDFVRKGRPGITDLVDTNGLREEEIQSGLIQHLNDMLSEGLGKMAGLDKPLPYTNLIKASSRAFTGYLQFVRFNAFTDILQGVKGSHEMSFPDIPFTPDHPQVTDLGTLIGNLTGRAKLGPGDKYANLQALANAVFYTVRKVASDWLAYNPVEIGRLYVRAARSGDWEGKTLPEDATMPQKFFHALGTGNYVVANHALSSAVFGLSALAGFYGLAASMGLKVDLDRHSSNYGSVEVNGEKIKPLSGQLETVRLMSMLYDGYLTTQTGNKVYLDDGNGPTSGGVIGSYVRNKMVPTAGTLTDLLMHHDAVGRPFDWDTELREDLEPIVASSLIGIWNNNPSIAAATVPSLTAMFGIHVASPMPPAELFGMNVWGLDVDPFKDPPQTDVDRELFKIGYTAKMPQDNIKSVKLLDWQYKDYIRLYGNQAYDMVQTLMSSPDWENLNAEQKIFKIQKTLSIARKFAQANVEKESIGSENDITQKANDAKERRMGLLPPENEEEMTSPTPVFEPAR